MPYVRSIARTGQLCSGPGSSTQPLPQLAVGGQVLPASWPQRDLAQIDQIQSAAMRSKEALTAMVIGAAALAAQQPITMAPCQEFANVQMGSATAFCYGTCSSTAGSSTSTPTPLHALQSLRDGGSFTTTHQGTICARAGTGGVASARVALQPCVGHCTGLDDSTSPLSASSRVAVNGSLTPCGSEALSGPRPGCKRTFNHAFQQQQQPLMQYQQQLQLQQQHQAALLLQKQVQQQQLQQQQQQQQAQAAARLQHASLQQQQQQQLVLQRLLRSQAAASAAPVVARQQQQYAYHVPPQPQVVQPLLVSQGSGSSTTSSCGSLAHRPPACPPAAAAPAAAPTNNVFMQQRHTNTQQQQTMVNMFAVSRQQQQRPPVAVLGTNSAFAAAAAAHPQQQQHRHEQLIDSQSWTAYLQRLQEQPTQPPAKRTATAAAYSAAAASAKQQQLLLQHQQLQQHHFIIPTSNTASQQQQQQQQLLMSAASSTVIPIISAPPSQTSKLLSWAGQLLKCQLAEAYFLAQHIYTRSVSQLDDMLLITLGVNQPLDKVAMLVSLWLATKLEGHRRQVVGCSKLAAALQMVPWAVTSVELHIMQALHWRPYEGFREASCQVTELA